MKSYGLTQIDNNTDEISYHVENLRIRGYSILKKVVSESDCDSFNSKTEDLYKQQCSELPEDDLIKINEKDLVRLPFLYDAAFTNLFTQDLINEIVSKYIGSHYYLHLQNAIINRPSQEHHQSSWHRDLPYQDWIISKPLAVNAFYCMSDFTAENGATFVLPFSHKIEKFPSKRYVEENQIQMIAPKGSVVLFDSMVFHRASFNSTSNVRYGINNMFVVPILKQQINMAKHANLSQFDDKARKLIGISYQLEENVYDYRLRKLEKHV